MCKNIQDVRTRSASVVSGIQERRKGKAKSIAIVNAVDFEQIVLKNTVMADNTLFIKQICKEQNNVGFFFPRRFCKTTLLSMTHLFLNAEIDQKTGLPFSVNFTYNQVNYFKKCVNEFFGNYSELRFQKFFGFWGLKTRI